VSKFPPDVLRTRIFPYREVGDPEVVLGDAFGEEVALTRVGGDVLRSHINLIAGAIGNVGWLAVHAAGNAIAASGVPPRWILILALRPLGLGFTPAFFAAQVSQVLGAAEQSGRSDWLGAGAPEAKRVKTLDKRHRPFKTAGPTRRTVAAGQRT